MFLLGAMYANGEGVIEDDVEAYAWVNVAAAKGEKKAAPLMSIWSSRMLFACTALMPAQENAQTLFCRTTSG